MLVEDLYYISLECLIQNTNLYSYQVDIMDLEMEVMFQ